LSIVKIEPCDNDDDDSQTNLEIQTEQILPTIKPEPVEDCDPLPLPSIDDSLSISIKKLQDISAKSSLSITLEPIDNPKITKPSVNLSSKTSTKSSMSITLQPKSYNNLSSTANNSSSSVSLVHSLPSTSSSSMYNTPQQILLQNEQQTTSTIKIPHTLSSNTVIHPKSIDRQVIFLKPISPSNQYDFSESPKIKTPIISKCISLAGKSHTYNSNSSYGTNPPSDCIIIDDDTEGFVEEDNGFIYEISKSVILPSVFWKIVHNSARNSTAFYQRCSFSKTVKNIIFNNSLWPIIQIYGKKYEYNKPIKTKNELQNLIEKIDCVEKCYGVEGIVHDNCIGYYEDHSEDVHSCTSCLKRYQELHNIVESRTKTIESLEHNVS